MEVDNPLLYTQHFMWTVRQIKKEKRWRQSRNGGENPIGHTPSTASRQ